jgi:salicylate biosynthesis isochorismate synthase/menaquinone-specific isochorismate synthase
VWVDRAAGARSRACGQPSSTWPPPIRAQLTGAAERDRAGRPLASDARRSAASRTPQAVPAHPGARGHGPRLVRGPVGWTDANEDGEFCVALRWRPAARHGGLRLILRRGSASCASRTPAAELAETEVKLGALLPVLAG